MIGDDASKGLVFSRSMDDGEVITYCYKDRRRPAVAHKVHLTSAANEVLLARLGQEDHRGARDVLGETLLPLAAPDPGITITSMEARRLDLGPTFGAGTP